MRALLLSVVLFASACGGDTRINVCGPCSYPEGSCADLDGTGQAVCIGGQWKTDLMHVCTKPVCAVQMPHTYKGEQPWCWYDKGTCR